MEQDQTFTRQAVCQMVRVTDEVATFWIKRGLLIPSSGGAGKGSHRRFSLDEVRIACVLRAARDAGLNISALSSIAERARLALHAYRSHGVEHRYFLDVVAAAEELWEQRKRGVTDLNYDFSYLAGYSELSGAAADRLVIAAKNISANPHDPYLIIGHDLVEAAGSFLTVFKTEDGSWSILAASPESAISIADTSEFYIVFALDRVMKPLLIFLNGEAA